MISRNLTMIPGLGRGVVVIYPEIWKYYSDLFAVGVRGGAPYFSGLGWSGADAKKRKVEK